MSRRISKAFVLAWGLAVAGCGGHAMGPSSDGGDGGADSPGDGAADAADADPPADADAPAEASVACSPLGPPPAGPRPSSLRVADCDFGEKPDFATIDLFCPDGCPEPPQPGDQRCHRVCDDGLCAVGERCEKRLTYVSDTPSQYANLCMCAAGGCAPAPTSAPEGGLASWEADAPLPIDLYYHAAAAGAGRVFVSGGLTIDQIQPGGASLKAVDQIFGATLGEGGRVTAWMPVGTLPAPLYFHATAVAAGRLYLSGGGQLTFDRSVHSAEILPDGTLGPWRAEAPLPTGRSWHRLLAQGGTLVVAGGSEWPTAFTQGTTSVAVAALDADGVVGDWTERFVPSPVFYDGGAGLARDRLYVLGEDGVLRSAALPALASWRPESTWPPARAPFGPTPPTNPNMGPVNLFEQCGVLVAILARGQTLTAPLGDGGVVGPWRIASRFHGVDTGFAAAATGAAVYATGGARFAERVVDVWSTHRR